MRLYKLLNKHHLTTKKAVKAALKQGLVSIDGQVVTNPQLNVDPQIQDIQLNGKKLEDSSQVYYILHKPKGYVTAVSDSKLPTVFDLLRPEDRRVGLYHIGRLDASTEGLLLLTNNGPLSLRLLHPDHHVPKTYLVEVNARLDWRAIDRFSQGIRFRDGSKCKPALLTLLEDRPGYTRAQVTLSEGKFHQVKKMFLAVGAKVIYLKRLRFGPFTLDETLLPGQYRPLSSQELVALKPFLD
ncbi:pseudouridine synthase [Streptococcus ovuberis]|uniref:Pseudouridine synthase n=1 Tax=Streptococcus ovuberis TaxID=1936207 RepID=A0A7X6S1L9_9STRE|nr:pseudouridine synthase [Streptococcus ovuberis]NKZ20495.1 rRNA pseudouridine synthase [Streptococcus ovuberis]